MIYGEQADEDDEEEEEEVEVEVEEGERTSSIGITTSAHEVEDEEEEEEVEEADEEDLEVEFVVVSAFNFYFFFASWSFALLKSEVRSARKGRRLLLVPPLRLLILKEDNFVNIDFLYSVSKLLSKNSPKRQYFSFTKTGFLLLLRYLVCRDIFSRYKTPHSSTLRSM